MQRASHSYLISGDRGVTLAAMDPYPPLWFGEAEAAELLPLEEAIDVLADAHVAYAQGGAASMRRAHVEWGDAILHAVGGVVEGIAGTKTWLYTPSGARPLLVLFAVEGGAVLGVVEAFALGKARTAATTGLGTRALARADADVLALLGTGKQALTQAQAVAAVRPLREVRVFGRDTGRRTAFAERVEAELGIAVSEHEEPRDALAGASIVTAITRAQSPLVAGDMLAAGMHVNAVGAIVPTRRELDAGAVGRCAVVTTDSRQQAEHDAGELRAAVDAGGLRWEDVAELGEVLTGARPGRNDEDDITLFKALGVGLADVALGAELLRRAAAAGRLPGHAHRALARTPTPSH